MNNSEARDVLERLRSDPADGEAWDLIKALLWGLSGDVTDDRSLREPAAETVLHKLQDQAICNDLPEIRSPRAYFRTQLRWRIIDLVRRPTQATAPPPRARAPASRRPADPGRCVQARHQATRSVAAPPPRGRLATDPEAPLRGREAEGAGNLGRRPGSHRCRGREEGRPASPHRPSEDPCRGLGVHPVDGRARTDRQRHRRRRPSSNQPAQEASGSHPAGRLRRRGPKP